MRILFIGSTQFSHHCLDTVLRNDGNVVGIINPLKENAVSISDYTDLSDIGREYKIPLYRVIKIADTDCINYISSLMPDVIFVFGFSQLIPDVIRLLPQNGCIGTHPTLLPKNRGRHPLIWTLIHDLSESGLSFFYINKGVDSGDIVWQGKFTISETDDASSLYKKIIGLADEAIPEILAKLDSGNLNGIPQDHTMATYWPKRTESDGLINWNDDNRTIFNLIRALTHPYPGAHTYSQKRRCIVWKSKLSDLIMDDHKTPGEIILSDSDKISVACGTGILEITSWTTDADCNLAPGTILG